MGLADWLQARTGLADRWRSALAEPVAGGASWARITGTVLVSALALEAVTGLSLMTGYAPSATTAWSSVHHLTHAASLGWLVRGLHHFGAHATVVAALAHATRLAATGGYRKPRELVWIASAALVLVTLALAATGNPLRWDQRAYWALQVETGIAATVPGIGPWLRELVLGGPALGHATLTRLHTLHVAVLPALALGLAWLARTSARRAARGEARDDAEPYWPRQASRDVAGCLALLGLVAALALQRRGAPLGAPADPVGDYPARPEWYFLALYELRKHVGGALEAAVVVGLPGVLVAYAAALPFAVGAEASARRRRLVLAPLAIALLGAAALTVVGMRADASDPKLAAALGRADERAARAHELAQAGVPPDGPLAMLRDDPETRGADLFARHCATCHRLGELGPADGKVAAPDLTGWGTRPWLLALLERPDDPKLFGKTPFVSQMPSFVHPPADPEAAKMFTPLDPAQSEAVVAFLLGQARGERGDGSAGEKVVKTRCTTCHRLDGKPPDDSDALGPELRGWASQAWTEAQIARPDSGKAYPPGAMAKELEGHMPAFDEELSDKDRSVVAAWTRRRASAAGPAPR